MKLPLSPVLGIFGSTLTLFDVSHGRDALGRPAPPIISANRNTRGIIQPSDQRALAWAERAGILTQGGAMTMHTKAAVYVVDLQAGALTIDAVNRSLITGSAPKGASYVTLTIGANPPVDVPVTNLLWSYAPTVAPAIGIAISGQGHDNDAQPVGGMVATLAGGAGSGAGIQTYARHAGKIWKAWSIGDWRPHTNIGRYILTLYYDLDGFIN